MDLAASEGRFFFLQWENDCSFVLCSWRSTIEATKQAWLECLSYSPHRLIILKVVRVSLEDELAITRHLNDIAPASLSAPWWRPNNALLQDFVRELPCSTREARSTIGHYKGRLLWRPTTDNSLTKTAKEIIIELLGASALPLAPVSIHALPTIALPLQTIYNTLNRLLKEGIVERPEQGLYVLSPKGQALYDALVAPEAPRKSARSLRP